MWARDGARVAARPAALGLAFAVLIGVCAFLLIRPLVGAGPGYGPRPTGTTYAYSFLVVTAFVPYAVAVWASRRGVTLRNALLGAAGLHLVLLPAAITQSQDAYAYLFYGKAWAVHGANPYVDLPLAFASDPWFAWVRWPDQSSVYGPAWTLLTGAAAWLSGGSLAAGVALVKGLVLVLDVAAVGGVVAAATDRGVRPGPAVVLVAWNPLVLVSWPLGAHADVAVAAGLVWASVADRRGRSLTASVLLAGATLVKAYAGIALLVYLLALLRRRWTLASAGAAAAAGVAALLWAPFWVGPRTLAGVAAIGERASASLAGTAQLALGEVLSPGSATWAVRLAGLAAIAAVVWVVARRPAFPEDPCPGVAAAFAAYLAVTPWLLYWHVTGLLPLAAVAASAPLRAATFTFSGTAMLTASFGATWWGRAVQTALRYGPPAVAFTLASAPEPAWPRWPRPQRSSAGSRGEAAPTER